MRTLILAFFFLSSLVPVAFADSGGTTNGSVCDLNGAGTGGGMMYNGQCLAPNYYPTQSGVTGTNGSTANTGNVTLINPLKSGTSLESFLTSILSFVIRIGTIAIILMLVFVGYKFVAAQGSDSKLIEARNMLLWTVIGALVLLGAQAIASAIQATVTALGG